MLKKKKGGGVGSGGDKQDRKASTTLSGVTTKGNGHNFNREVNRTLAASYAGAVETSSSHWLIPILFMKFRKFHVNRRYYYLGSESGTNGLISPQIRNVFFGRHF